MRHQRRINHLGRTAAHRKAMLSNMACSLIKHKRISTTLAKAKELRKFVEPLVTKTKGTSLGMVAVNHLETVRTENGKETKRTTVQKEAFKVAALRTVFSYLHDKHAVKELFTVIRPRIEERPGGYTRILKTGFRQGDNAEMCIIEFVDFNETYTQNTGKKKATKTRRSRGKKAAAPVAEVEAAPATEAQAE